jgi:hypothetical protein
VHLKGASALVRRVATEIGPNNLHFGAEAIDIQSATESCTIVQDTTLDERQTAALNTDCASRVATQDSLGELDSSTQD